MAVFLSEVGGGFSVDESYKDIGVRLDQHFCDVVLAGACGVHEGSVAFAGSDVYVCTLFQQEFGNLLAAAVHGGHKGRPLLGLGTQIDDVGIHFDDCFEPLDIAVADGVQDSVSIRRFGFKRNDRFYYIGFAFRFREFKGGSLSCELQFILEVCIL